MSISFPHSMRSLHQAKPYPSLIALICAIVLSGAWLVWFFFAQVTLYEVSQDFEVRDGEALAVYFPAEALARIQPGQAASLRLNENGSQQAVTWPALVMNVPYLSSTGPVEVHVFSPMPLLPDLTGQVRIEVAYVSPATLVMRAVGKFVDDPKLLISPQRAE